MGWRRFSVILSSTLILVSCAKAPTSRFYALPLQSPPVTEGSRALGFTVAIGPVDMPEYLDRPQIVTRIEGSQLQVHEYDRWGGLLAEDTARVLADELSARLGGAKVYLYPSRVALDLDYRVALQVTRFDGMLGEAVELRVAWSILDARQSKTLEMNQQGYRTRMRSKSFDDYAIALSATLAQLGGDLAKSIRALHDLRRGQ